MTVPSWQTEYAALGDCRIALYDTGPSDGATIVFSHGIGGAKSVWIPVLEHLPKSWRLIAYDYRGGGESEETVSQPLSLHQWAIDLKALLGERQVESSPVLVGHSLGASIVLQFTLDWPDVPGALVLIGAEAGLCRLGPMMQERSRAIVESGIDGWIKGPWRAAPPFSKATQTNYPDMIDKYSEMLYLTGADRYLRAVTAIAESPDLTEHLGGIAVPTLVLIGGEDDRTTPEAGWDLVAGLPSARGVEVADVGHTLSYEAPERVVGELVQFVREHDLA